MRRIFVAAFAGLVSIGAGVAADDPIHARKALMEANGKVSKPIVAIMKGAPFQLQAVQAALKQFIETSEKAAALFPPGSDKGKTEALPVIWANKSDFDARLAKLGTDSKAALAAIKDKATFNANMPAVFKNCGGCHELYRAKEK